MRLTREDFDAKFQVYRAHLSLEIGRFWDCVSVLRQIGERTHDHLAEINLAPAFFRTVERSLFTAVVLRADKLFDEEGERGLFNFLAFIENNRDWMTVKELQRRKNFPDGHWILLPEYRGPPITFQSIQEDRQRIRGVAALKSIKLWRDKFEGHYAKDYFFDRHKLAEEAPILWQDVEEAARVMGRILNNYSIDFDGEEHVLEMAGIDDLSSLLSMAAKGRG